LGSSFWQGPKDSKIEDLGAKPQPLEERRSPELPELREFLIIIFIKITHFKQI